MPGAHGMPDNWDDHEAWERHHAHAVAPSPEVQELAPSEAVRFAGWIAAQGYRRIWFPGCGLDGAPRIYASLGYQVWASDVSRSAVEYQQRLAHFAFDSLRPEAMETVQRYLPSLTEWSEGALRALAHDFREPFTEEGVDCILNVRAYQALPEASMRRAARTFFRALRPGGHAFFDTQNVQGERRDRLEDALIEAGFALPGVESERRLRRAVDATGIPHLFVLGRPFVWRQDPRYRRRGGKRLVERDQEQLHAVHAEYSQAAEAEQEEVGRLYDDPRVTTAVVVYNTG